MHSITHIFENGQPLCRKPLVKKGMRPACGSLRALVDNDQAQRIFVLSLQLALQVECDVTTLAAPSGDLWISFYPRGAPRLQYMVDSYSTDAIHRCAAMVAALNAQDWALCGQLDSP